MTGGADPELVEASASFAALAAPMRAAITAALEAGVAGSLAIGAAVAGESGVIAQGRNRLHETDAGDDRVAGTSLAHAEINALAKLRFRAHESDELELHTTLQPCLQCLGAIRLSPIRRVSILAPDPLWIGVEGIRHTTSFVSARWPDMETLPASEWSVLALLSPTRHALGHPRLADAWRSALPATSEVAADVDVGALGSGSTPERATRIWTDLTACVAEVEGLAERARVHQTD